MLKVSSYLPSPNLTYQPKQYVYKSTVSLRANTMPELISTEKGITLVNNRMVIVKTKQNKTGSVLECMELRE